MLKPATYNSIFWMQPLLAKGKSRFTNSVTRHALPFTEREGSSFHVSSIISKELSLGHSDGTVQR